MSKMSLVFVLALVACLSPFGSHAMSGGDVVTDAGSFSFQVAIQPVTTPSIGLNVCSGVIVKGLGLDQNGAYVEKYFILSAASCLITATTYNLYLGTNEVRRVTPADVRGVAVADVVFHPEFLTSGMTKGDLAIITADSITDFIAQNPAKRLTAATLPSISTSDDSFLGSSVNMAGWGYPYDSFGGTSPRLRQLNSRVVPNWYCSLINYGKPVTSKHICTGGLINKGPCTGDAGAPLVLRSDSGSRVIGLATLVPTNGCMRSKPGVFTRLGSYLQWIMQVTNYNPDN